MKRIIADGEDRRIELGISREKIAGIIEKARMFDAKEELSDPQSGSNATDDDMRDILEDTADDPTQQELVQLIRDLDEDEQIGLVALAWIGRGTYAKSQWSEALEQARFAHNGHTAEYLVGLPLLGDYLEEGLAQLDEAGFVVSKVSADNVRRSPRPVPGR
jgi:hypothetical protein